MPDGTHYFRLLPPHTEKNPNGITDYISHKIYTDRESKEYTKVFCPFSYGEDCVLCSFVSEVTDPENGFKGTLPGDVYGIIESWAPTVNRLVPSVWRLSKEPSKKNPQFFDYQIDSNGELPILLNLVAGKKSLDGFYDDIIDMVTDDGDLPDLEDGHWIKCRKNRAKYDLSPTKDDTPIATGDDIIAQYAPLNAFGKNFKKDRGSTIALIESTWAYREFVKAAGTVDWDAEE